MTLIELMIVVLLIGILAVATTPFTASWFDNSRLTETIGIVEQAVGKARSAALRNPSARSGNQPVSMICNDNTNHVMHIVEYSLATATLSCDAASKSWNTKLATRVVIKAVAADASSANWSCTCFTNKGLIPLPAPAACSACSTTLKLTISSGNDNETITFN